jgi:hypothetical protein
MTSSPGLQTAISVAIIVSVAPQQTVTFSAGSVGIPLNSAACRATASRSRGVPQVTAYWLWPSLRARQAASMICGGGSKSGNPCARFTPP